MVMTDSRGKKTLGGLTRHELARALRIGLTTCDKLIANGLTPIGRRGRAHLYRLGDARRLARKLAPPQTVGAAVLVADYGAQVEDLRERTRALHEGFIAEAVWRPVWERHVEAMARQTATWPARLERAVARMPASQLRWLSRAEGVVVPSPAPAPALLRELQLTEAQWRRRQPTVPAAMLRPLLAALAGWLKTAPSLRAVAEVVATPPPPEAMPTPTDPAKAREQWRTARAEYRRTRTAVRRGHLPREALYTFVTESGARHMRAWLTGWRRSVPQVVDDPASAPKRVRALAEQLRVEALGALTAPEDTEGLRL